jgi:hypothetical protein
VLVKGIHDLIGKPHQAIDVEGGLSQVAVKQVDSR